MLIIVIPRFQGEEKECDRFQEQLLRDDRYHYDMTVEVMASDPPPDPYELIDQIGDLKREIEQLRKQTGKETAGT